MRIRALLLVALFFSVGTIFAQQNNLTLTGKIIDRETGEPLPFSTISLFAPDSSLVKGAVASADGTFDIKITPGTYQAVIQMVSYEPHVVTINPEFESLKLGTIQLTADTKTLDEVVVQGQRSMMQMELDKRVFNVSEDLSNIGRTASDILDNIPSITVDPDGNVSLRGSQNVRILIDGKPSGLVGLGGSSGLQSLQGSMIQRIEVITNPSVRYEAEGMAGIINIVLKKEKQNGLNGSVEATTGIPRNLGLSANLNFRKKAINYFVNYSLNYRRSPGGGFNSQHFFPGDTTYYTYIDRDQSRGGLSNSFRGGADWFVGEKSTLTGSFLVDLDNNKNLTDLTYDDSDEQHVLFQRTLRSETELEDEKTYEFSLNYDKRFRKEDQKLTAYLQYRYNDEIEDSDQQEGMTYARDGVLPPATKQQSLNDELERNIIMQADYVHPFGEKGKFETGFRNNIRDVGNDYLVEEFDPEADNWFQLPGFVNHFNYDENVLGAYALVGNRLGKISFEAGVRMEATAIETNLEETGERSSKSYVDWFPSIHTNYYFSDAHSIQVSYSRRISRPRYRWLNPFSSYTDSRNLRTGNPDLNPEYTNSYEMGYLVNGRLSSFYGGVYYRFTDHVIERVSYIDEIPDQNGEMVRYTYTKPINLSTEDSYGVEGNVTQDIADWWTVNANFNLYRAITDGQFEGQELSRDTYTWNLRTSSKFSFWNNANLQVSLFYRAPQETTQGRRKSFYTIDLAMNKDVLGGDGTVSLGVRDLMNTRKWRFIDETSQFTSEGEFQWRSRTAQFSFVYRINKKKSGQRRGENAQDGGPGEGGEDMDIGGEF